MKIHHYNDHGQPCDKFGRIIHPKVVRDGESITVSVLLMDNGRVEDADPYGDREWFGNDTADTSGSDPYNDAAWFGDDYQPDRPPQRTADADTCADAVEADYDDDWLHQAA